MISRLVEFIQAHPRLLVLTGAGCSADSGIPTYRDDQGTWQRSTPIRHQDFIDSEASRRRYWTRSLVGWPAVRDAAPGPAHGALAALENQGLVRLLVTQNVDRLHQRAGQRQVVDLHGRLDQVVCLACGHVSSRDEVQQQLLELNPRLAADSAAVSLAPDGDADVPERWVDTLRIPECRYCGGTLKPNVVFFGGSVDRDLVAFVYDEIEASDAVLVVGSSLMVFSGYRFCRHAAQQHKPIACINRGRTRADDLFSLKLEQECGAVLEALCQALP
ncbi:MAG: NAD-dependent protein deacetylase [Gammaproteobacteria bacterium]|nr:NAD-dependent protein deacetylase [Pseudomonadales bacterium]MCP5348742.1 NAD-dependent protein deacetylase [Pseudomonadales bacterium]